MPRTAEDLTGHWFGSRKVLRRAENKVYNGKSTVRWVTRCKACHEVQVVQNSHLKRGDCPCQTTGKGKRPRRPRPKPRPKASGQHLTLGQLRKALQDAPDDLPICLAELPADGQWKVSKAKSVMVLDNAGLIVVESDQ